MTTKATYMMIASCSAESGASWEPCTLYAGADRNMAEQAAVDSARSAFTKYDTYTLQIWRFGDLSGQGDFSVKAMLRALPPEQYEWAQHFTDATKDAGDGVSKENLVDLLGGHISWAQFMDAEITSYLDWKGEALQAIWDAD